jgi:ribosomal protein L30/L7E
MRRHPSVAPLIRGEFVVRGTVRVHREACAASPNHHVYLKAMRLNKIHEQCARHENLELVRERTGTGGFSCT